jgi:hypothetical protein
MATQSEDYWQGIKQGFIEGFKFAYNHEASVNGTAVDAIKIDKDAKRFAEDHLQILKSAR